MEQAVEFEPTDSVVFMLNTIANNIAQRNANYLTTLQNVSIGISGFTNRLVNPFSQACFNLFMLFKTFTFDSFDRFSSSEFLATKARRQKRSRIEEIMAQAFVMYFRIQGHWSRCRDARPVTTENISFSPAFITRKL